MAQPKYWSRHPIDPAEAVELMRSRGLEPLDPYLNAKTRWRCLCMTTGKETAPTLDKVKSKDRHVCSWCAFNATVDPEAAAALMRASQLEPLVPFPGKSGIPWPCQCLACGSDTSPSYNNVQRRGHQCGTCGPTRSGFKSQNPAMVYLCVNARRGALKVGIGSPTSVRLDRHRVRGWATVMTVTVTGAAALAIERRVLNWWRNDLGLPPYLSAREMPQGGWTETVDLDAVDIPTVKAFIQALASKATDTPYAAILPTAA
jgi:hypothetical protein